VTPDAPLDPVRIVALLTGEDVPEGNWDFVGTTLLEGGNYVLHVFMEDRGYEF
jgi:hypothetical protein